MSNLERWLGIGCVALAIVCCVQTGRVAKLKSEAEALQAEAQQRSERMKAEADAINADYQLRVQAHEKTIADLRSRLRDGSLRLSVPVSQSGNTAVGTGEGRAELNGEFAESLVAITDRGDRAIEKLNFCIDRYESARKANGNAVHESE